LCRKIKNPPRRLAGGSQGIKILASESSPANTPAHGSPDSSSTDTSRE
jgi:hypothetical protein